MIPEKDDLFCETVLKYADLDEIQILIALYGRQAVERIWRQTIKTDARFKRLNYFLARVYFDMDVEAIDFEGVEYARLAKFRQLAD